MPLTDIETLLAEVATPPPILPSDSSQLRIADIGAFTADQVRAALHVIAESFPMVRNSKSGAPVMVRAHVPARYLTYGALLQRGRASQLHKQWGYLSVFAFLLEELHIPYPLYAHRFTRMYYRAQNLGFTPEEMEDLERQHPWRRTMTCVKYAVNKKHCLLALNARGYNMQRLLYAGSQGKRNPLTFGPFLLSKEKHLTLHRLLGWFGRELHIVHSDALVAMALIIQAWLEKPPMERQRFLRTQLKELGINPEIAKRFF